MDECVDALPTKPQIERDIGVTGGARKIVILRIAMIEVTAFRLDRDDDLATPDPGKTKFAAMTTGIILRRAPGVDLGEGGNAVMQTDLSSCWPGPPRKVIFLCPARPTASDLFWATSASRRRWSWGGRRLGV